MAEVGVEAVSKSFSYKRRAVTVLDDVTLTVGDGEFVSLVGRSGCGKSTLLRIIAGFLPPDSGAVRVGGALVRGPGLDRGMLFQQPMLFPWLTVFQNTLFGPKAQGKVTPAVREQALEVLATVGLLGFEAHYPKQLSGGMMQRAAFARAMMAGPEVLLLDEPFGSLDALTRTVMQVFLLDLWQGRQFTTVLVTHDIEEAVLLGDRVVTMGSSPGRIVDDIRVTLARPRTLEMSESREFLELRRRVRLAVNQTAAGTGDADRSGHVPAF